MSSPPHDNYLGVFPEAELQVQRMTKEAALLIKEHQTQINAQPPLLHRAQVLINGDRQKDYGDTLTNFEHIAAFWNAHLMLKLAPEQKITAEDVALMMINLKQARLAKTPDHADSILDVAGYAGCYDKIQQERKAL